MSNRTILITGGAGFIGSNFIPFFLENYQEVSVVNPNNLNVCWQLGVFSAFM